MKYLFIFAPIFSVMFISFLACQNPGEPISPFVEEDVAKVIAVSCTGQENNYTLSVTIESPDTGCDQYANWWEVITPQGELIYRRILGHSHVDEQPFTRSGGPVVIGANDSIIVRAHMNNLSYGSQVFKGAVVNDLVQDSLSSDYAINLETIEPLPGDCPF